MGCFFVLYILAEKYESVDADEINKEMVAYFVCDNMFQKKFGDLGRLATELTGTKKQKFISFMKNIFKKFSNAFSEFGQLEKKFLSLYDSAMQNKNTDNNDGVKSMKNIDSDENNRYNKIKGGVNNEESSDSKLLEKGRVSTISGNRNSLRKQSSNTEKISKLLGLSAKNIKAGESTGSGVFDRNVEHFYDSEGKVSGRSWKSAIGNLSRIDLQAVDTVGRKIDEAELKDSAFSICENQKKKQLDIILKNNPANDDYHTLLSGFIDGNYFVPIRFGIKENTQGKNKLYIVVEQNKIDLKVLKSPVLEKGYDNSRLRSTISISEIFKNVNWALECLL